MTYHFEFYNKMNETEQWIRLSDGCYLSDKHIYCKCPNHKINYEIPPIQRNIIKIIDMNFLYCRLDPIKDLDYLGSQKVNNKVIYYEMICGFDYRLVTQQIADKLKQNRFKNIRIAWDGIFLDCDKINNCIELFKKAGYKAKQIQVFMICDWKIPFEVVYSKVEFCYNMGVQVSDCWFDNVKPPNYQCNFWTLEQCKEIRKIVRSNNIKIRFNGYDPTKKGVLND